jgi:poly-gamma-glutamate capsule biosynthesis protein CapA/YwtB (metallophosphatase superfamily)
MRRLGTAVVLMLLAGCTTTGEGEARAPSPTSTAPPPPSTGSSAPPPVASITIAAVGDILMGSAPDKLPPGDGRGFFTPVAEALRADLTMGNLETPLSDATGFTKCQKPSTTPPPDAPPPTSPTAPPKETCFAFRLPPSYASVLKDGGFQILNLANNHTNDAGPVGLRNTRSALAGVGLRPTGGAGEIATHEAHGITVAVLGFGPYAWMQNVTDVAAGVALVRKAAAQADLVVVNMHVGGEGADHQHVRPGTEFFLGENRGDPIGFAHAVVDAGADLVVGHSPHVLRGMEFYRGKLIAYSMGNFAGYRVLSSAYPLGVGAVLRATLAKDGTWVSGSLVGTEMVGGGTPALDPRGRALTLVRDLSAADLGASAVKVAPEGTLSP